MMKAILAYYYVENQIGSIFMQYKSLFLLVVKRCASSALLVRLDPPTLHGVPAMVVCDNNCRLADRVSGVKPRINKSNVTSC